MCALPREEIASFEEAIDLAYGEIESTASKKSRMSRFLNLALRDDRSKPFLKLSKEKD